MSTPDKEPIPMTFEKWIDNWIHENVVSGPNDGQAHNAKVIWARAIAIDAYRHLSSQKATPSDGRGETEDELRAIKSSQPSMGLRWVKPPNGGDTLYTYWLLEFEECGSEFDYTICETLGAVKSNLQMAEGALDDDTIKAQVTITGVALTKKEWNHWQKSSELPDRFKVNAEETPSIQPIDFYCTKPSDIPCSIQCDRCKSVSPPQPIADKEVPEDGEPPKELKDYLEAKMRPYHNRISFVAGALECYHKMQEEINDILMVHKSISDSYNELLPESIKTSANLIAARTEISTQAIQIAGLLASNKEWGERYAEVCHREKDTKRQTIDSLYQQILTLGVEFEPAAREVFHQAKNALTT